MVWFRVCVVGNPRRAVIKDPTSIESAIETGRHYSRYKL